MLPPEPARPPAPEGFARETLARLPLAASFYAVFGHIADDATLQALFDQHRGRCYDDALSFPDLVSVVADALVLHQGSARPAIADALEDGVLPCRQRAVYGKLARVPLALSEAFLPALTARLLPLFPDGAAPAASLPASLDGFAVVVLDGKKIKKAAKRLLATRGRPGKLFGGKILAAYMPATGLAVSLASDPDGEANDCKLVPRALETARACVPGPRLWVADRQFCDLGQPARFAEGGDRFLVRWSKKLGFHADPEHPSAEGKDARGRTVREEWGWLGAASQGARRLRVRRITLVRPGSEDVALVTDLLDAERWPAADLLAVYLARWQIEGVFQQITEVFGLAHLIGSAPAATVFQASLCLAICNVLRLLRTHAAACRAMAADDVSAEMMFRDMRAELAGLHKTLSLEEVLSVLEDSASAEQARGRLARLMAKAWSPLWKKAKNKSPRPARAKAKQSGAHTSVHKILQEAKAAKGASPKKAAGRDKRTQ